MKTKIACFENGFTIEMTLGQAKNCSHPGPCDAEVSDLLATPEIQAQFANITPAQLFHELRGYGAWDDNELADENENKLRILWIAAGDIREEANHV